MNGRLGIAELRGHGTTGRMGGFGKQEVRATGRAAEQTEDAVEQEPGLK